MVSASSAVEKASRAARLLDVHPRLDGKLGLPQHGLRESRGCVPVVLDTLGNLKGFLTKEALKSVNSVHTDNGSEFKGEFDEYLLENHIQHQWGTPNRPVSNGLIERQVGEIKRGIRTILLESKLPVAFWSYAAAVWVFN